MDKASAFYCHEKEKAEDPGFKSPRARQKAKRLFGLKYRGLKRDSILFPENIRKTGLKLDSKIAEVLKIQSLWKSISHDKNTMTN